MKRLLSILFILLLLVVVPHEAAARSFTIDEVDIHAYVLEDGSLYVEELYTYTFSGEYNGTTRAIGNDKHDGIGYFEGYLAPADTDLDRYDPANFRPLEVERSGSVFKVHTPSKDETKKVFYRYLIHGAAKNYMDTGELYWRFFDSMNETDIRNLKIRVVLSGDKEATLAGQAFLHGDYGQVEMTSEEGVVYRTDMLPAGETVELRYLFPETFLAKRDMTKHAAVLDRTLKEEGRYRAWMKVRSQYLPLIDRINGVALVASLLFFVVVLLYPKRLIRFLQSAVRVERLQEMDSFLLATISRRGGVRPNSIVAGLLRLHQKGIARMEQVTPIALFLADESAPRQTYRFTIVKEDAELSTFDRDLIDWLFTEDENGELHFSLDQFPYLTKKQLDSDWRAAGNAPDRIKAFRKRFRKWKKIIAADPEMQEYVVENPVRKWMIRVFLPVWVLLVTANVFIGSPNLIDTLIVFVVMASMWSLLLYRLNWWPSVLLFFGVNFVIAVKAPIQLPDLFFATNFIFLAASLLLPQNDLTKKGVSYYRAARRFKKDVRGGKFDFTRNGSPDTYFEHVISLELFRPLFKKYMQEMPEQLAALPLSINWNNFVIAFFYTYSSARRHMSNSGGGGGSSGGSGGGGGAGAF